MFIVSPFLFCIGLLSSPCMPPVYAGAVLLALCLVQ